MTMRYIYQSYLTYIGSAYLCTLYTYNYMLASLTCSMRPLLCNVQLNSDTNRTVTVFADIQFEMIGVTVSNVIFLFGLVVWQLVSMLRHTLIIFRDVLRFPSYRRNGSKSFDMFRSSIGKWTSARNQCYQLKSKKSKKKFKPVKICAHKWTNRNCQQCSNQIVTSMCCQFLQLFHKFQVDLNEWKLGDKMKIKNIEEFQQLPFGSMKRLTQW